MIGNLNTEQVEEVLKGNLLGRIGCNDGDTTYVVPVSYVYDGQFIIAHSVMGRKIEMMRKNPNICFEVDEVKSFTHWKSVIAWGKFEELTGEEEKYEAMKLFVDRMMYMKISKTAMPPEMSEGRLHPRSPGQIQAVIYRIRITHKTGRFEND